MKCHRHLHEGDIEELWLLISDPDLSEYLTWDMYTDKKTAQEFLLQATKKTGYPDEFVGLVENGRLIGTTHCIERYKGKYQFGFSALPHHLKSVAFQKSILDVISTIASDGHGWGRAVNAELLLDLHVRNAVARRVASIIGFRLIQPGIAPMYDRFIFPLEEQYVARMRLRLQMVERLMARTDVLKIFLTGSSATNSETNRSDIDMWVVFEEEEGLLSCLQDIDHILTIDGLAPTHLHTSTPTHHFARYGDIVADINFCSAATYFSLTGKKTVIAEKIRATSREDLLERAYTLSLRVLSKIDKKDLWSLPRFVNALREEALIPLLTYRGLVYNNKVDIDFSELTEKEKTLVAKTFCGPVLEQAIEALEHSNQIIKGIIHEELSDKVQYQEQLQHLERELERIKVLTHG